MCLQKSLELLEAGIRVNSKFGMKNVGYGYLGIFLFIVDREFQTWRGSLEISGIASCTLQMEGAKTQEGWAFHQVFIVESSFDPLECYIWLQLVDRDIPTIGGIKYTSKYVVRCCLT